MGKEAPGLAGYDDFEDFRVRSQLADELLPRIDRQRLHRGKMTEDGKDVSFGRSEMRFEADTAELQHGIGLIEMPGNIGGEGHGALETLIDGRVCGW